MAMIGQDEINRRIGFHPATPDRIPLYEANRAAAIAFATHLDATCPPSAELQLALRDVESALMRANQAVACNPVPDSGGAPAMVPPPPLSRPDAGARLTEDRRPLVG